MTTESGTWTVLPNGYDPDRELLRATLFFSPRLSTDGDPKRPLADYPLMSQWPTVVAGLRCRLDFGPLGVVDAEPDPLALKADQGVFDQVFDDRVFVVDHEFADHSEQVVHWFPANDLANDLLSTYAAVGAASPTALPPVTSGPLATFADDLGSLGNDPEHLHKRLGALLDAEQSSVVEGRRGRYVTRAAIASLGKAGHYALAQRFYDRYRDGTRLRTEAGHGVPALPPPELRPIDFHAYVGALGDYPNLLRLVGLAVDVVAKVPFNPSGKAAGPRARRVRRRPRRLVRRAGQHAVVHVGVRRAPVDPAVRTDPAGLLPGPGELPCRTLLGAPDRHRRVGPQGAQRGLVAAHPEEHHHGGHRALHDRGPGQPARPARCGLHGRALRPGRVDRGPVRPRAGQQRDRRRPPRPSSTPRTSPAATASTSTRTARASAACASGSVRMP